ncbi:MAG TPA: hypothetical protein VIH75_20915 [Candidatus Sulfotelmatobacter sp.]
MAPSHFGTWFFADLIGAARLTTAAAAAAKIHVTMAFRKWMSAPCFTVSGANGKPLPLQVRAQVTMDA